MSALGSTLRDPRVAVWAAAALVCTGYYWLRTQPFPRRTAVGVVHRLFGVGGQDAQLRENPGGGRWLLTVLQEPPAPSPALPARKAEWPGWLYEHAVLRLGARPRGWRPALTPVPFEGAWLLEGHCLRYRWRVAGDWLGDRHLGAEVFEERNGPPGNWLLDLRTGRTYRGAAADIMRQRIPNASSEEEPYYPMMDFAGPAPVAPALEDRTPGSSDLGAMHHLEGREVVLQWAAEGDFSGDLTAATTGEPYRSLALSPQSALVAVSRDERTLYLLKADGFWRLDLRKPVAELLREVQLPELPLDGVIPPVPGGVDR